jgi:hypothetical protein
MFEITPDDIAGLNDRDLRALVGQLCEAEVRSRGLSASFVTWGGDQNADDGGVDVDVALPAGTPINGFIPRPEAAFQVKKMKMPPGKIREEMRPEGAIRPAIQELADHGGAYIIVSSESATRRMLLDRLDAMKEAVGNVPNASALKVDFYDRGRMASWVRDHEGLVPWIREKIGKAIPGWHSYGAWAYPAEGAKAEYLLDTGLRLRTGRKEDSGQGLDAKQGLQHIRVLLNQPGSVARLVGLSGVGKTRFLQALFDGRVGENAIDPSLAVYTNVAEDPDPQPTALADDLIASGKRQILVIDNCTPDLHRLLSNVCRSQGSKLSLITVEYDVRDDQPEGTEVFRLEPSSVDLIEELIRHRFPALSVVNARTVAEHSGGNARMAIAIAGTIGKNETISGLNDDELFRRLFQQGHAEDDSLLQAAQALSLVYSFQGEDVSNNDDAELVRLGALVGKSAQEMFRHVAELYRRDLVQRRGAYRAVLPHALANHLAKRALQNIPLSVIEEQLVNGAPARLLRSFSRRLGYLSDSAEAAKIANGWLAPQGLLGEAGNFNDLGKAMFENIAPVAPEAALTAIERALLGPDAAEVFPRCTHYIRLLRQLAYDAGLFERCLTLILQFAAADEKEARDIFPPFFYLYLSGTRATLEQRQVFLRPLLESPAALRYRLGVEGLKASIEAWHFNSSNSFEFGARSRDPGYWPAATAEARAWYRDALKFAGEIAVSDLPAAADVRTAIADQLRGLWTVAHLSDEVEQLCRAISAKHFWHEGWIALREIQNYDSAGFAPEVLSRLLSLEKLLRPVDLVQQVRAIVLSRHPHDLGDFDGPGDIHERIERANATVLSLGKQVALDDAAFGALVGELVVHIQSNQHVWIFGQGLAEGSADPRATWNRLRLQLSATPEDKRNPVVLRGFIQGLQTRNPEAANDLLEEVVEDEVLGPYYPMLETAAKIDGRGVDRLMRSLVHGKAHMDMYKSLAYGRAADPIPPRDLKALVEKIASTPEGFDAAIEILHMRLHSEKDWEGGFCQDTLEAARQLMRQAAFDGRDQHEDYRLGEIAKACFAGPAGAAPVLEICRKVKDAVERRDTHPYYHDDLMVSLFTVQPRACLDGLCADGAAGLQRGMRIIDDIRQFKTGLLELVPDDVLLAWCDEEPASRYPAVAGSISFAANTADGRPREWTKLALRLLEKAPDRVGVLKRFTAEFRGHGGWGSPVAQFEANAKLLDKLENHPHPSVSAFVAEEKARLARQIDVERQLENSAERMASQSFE